MDASIMQRMTYNFSYFIQICQDVFGRKFNINLISEGIERTNENYGGFEIEVTNVVFPNGSLDQWHSLSITHSSANSTTPAIVIKGKSIMT